MVDLAPPPPRQAIIGDNGGPTFDDVVRENVELGILLSCVKSLSAAMQDLRVTRLQLRVFGHLTDFINAQTGMAYPGRKLLAERSGYSEPAVARAISELIGLGYIVSSRRQPSPGTRALSHYAFARPTIEEMRSEITKFVGQKKKAIQPGWKPEFRANEPYGGFISPNEPYGGADRANEPNGVSVRAPNEPNGVSDRANEPYGGNVSNGGFVRPPDEPNGVFYTKRDEYNGVPTVTKKERDSNKKVSNTSHTQTEVAAAQGAREGEDDIGFGVYVNGKSIRHAAFAINLDGIRMQTLASGLTKEQTIEICKGHALQWAVEIENGKRPGDVVPSKIANFLSSSIIATANRGAQQSVRVARAGRGYPINPDKPDETTAERYKRYSAEAAQKKKEPYDV